MRHLARRTYFFREPSWRLRTPCGEPVKLQGFRAAVDEVHNSRAVDDAGQGYP